MPSPPITSFIRLPRLSAFKGATGEVAHVGAVYSAFTGGGEPQSKHLQISDHEEIVLGAFPPSPRMTGHLPRKAGEAHE